MAFSTWKLILGSLALLHLLPMRGTSSAGEVQAKPQTHELAAKNTLSVVRMFPGAEELDYALLMVEGAPGSQPVSAHNAEPGAPTRGFIQVPVDGVDLRADTPLLIVQHPDGAPLKLAFDTQSITAVNGNRTRVRYRTNTEGGASGSPVFDANWNLLALHHGGDPIAKPLKLARWNQGIPIDSIRALISKRGCTGELG